MNSEKLVITIYHDGPTVPVDTFIGVTRRTITLLRGIDQKLTAEPSISAKWNICDVSMKSPLHLTVEAMAIHSDKPPRRIVPPFLGDMKRLEQGKPPLYLTPSLQRIASEIVRTIGRGITGIGFASDEEEVRPTERIAAYVTELEQTHSEMGSIEGKLEVINVHGQEEVKIWDARFNFPVICYVSRVQIEDAKEYLRRRVSIRGQIKYRRNHPFAMMNVYEIRRLDDPAGLPQVKDIAPVDLTGGQEPADYLRGID